MYSITQLLYYYPRPQEYYRSPVLKLQSGERFQKPPYLRSKLMLFTCGREVQSPFSKFENIQIRVDGASGVRLLVELCCVIVIKHVAFFAFCATLTMAVTLTSLLLNSVLLLCFRMWFLVSDLNKNICGSTDLAKKRYRFAYPYPLLSTVD